MDQEQDCTSWKGSLEDGLEVDFKMLFGVHLVWQLDLLLEAYLQRWLHVVCAKVQLYGGFLVSDDLLFGAKERICPGGVERFAEDRLGGAIFGRASQVDLEALVCIGDVYKVCC